MTHSTPGTGTDTGDDHIAASKHGCTWWGWWFVYPLANLRRVWRNAL